MHNKKIFILTFSIISVLMWMYLSKPNFVGEDAALREALWDWNTADSNEDRYNAAEKINFYNIPRELRKNTKKASTTLTENEELGLEEATAFFTDIGAQAESLEKSLSAKEIRQITKSNPDSIFNEFKRFQSSIFTQGKCTENDYQELKKSYSAEELYMRGIKVGLIIQLGEQKFLESYINSLIEVIKENPKKKEQYNYLIEFYYPRLISPSSYLVEFQKNFQVFGDSDVKRLKSYQDELIETGIKKSDLDDYVINFAKKSPRCLFGGNFSFLSHAQKGLGKERAEKILTHIKDESLRGKPLPYSIDDIDGNLGLLITDGHFQDFFIKRTSDHTLELLSVGEDLEENTKDDVSYGFVTLNPNL